MATRPGCHQQQATPGGLRPPMPAGPLRGPLVRPATAPFLPIAEAPTKKRTLAQSRSGSAPPVNVGCARPKLLAIQRQNALTAHVLTAQRLGASQIQGRPPLDGMPVTAAGLRTLPAGRGSLPKPVRTWASAADIARGASNAPTWKAAAVPQTGMMVQAGDAGLKKRKLSEAQEVCWDIVKKGTCPRGDSCPWSHDVDRNDFLIEPGAKKPKLGAGVKGRTDEDRAKAKEEYANWRTERLEYGGDPEGKKADALDWWYAQVCLVCLAECDLSIFEGHRRSWKHKQKYIEFGGLTLRPGVQRPDPKLQIPPSEPDMDVFLSTTGFAEARVLSLGEQDYSFSLAVAELQGRVAKPGVRLCASSYLAAHDPEEPEVHVRDDGVRSTYCRKSLPSMEGALELNIAQIEALGGQVLHSVDATDLTGTLLTQNVQGPFDVIVFPFPRASLRRGVDPMNPRLLRNFFRSVNDSGLLAAGGSVQLLLLRTQYPDWDTACVAAEAGFTLTKNATLPDGFYQSREMSGKTWKPKDGEVYVFQPQQ